MEDIDWNLIKSFVTVAETGSLSAAARKLSASQPTLGRHIGELEQALGVTLFRRGRRGYALTEAGATLFERGRAVSEQASACWLWARWRRSKARCASPPAKWWRPMCCRR
jgi:DNA-binding transcriptional LysR family regulator